MLHICYGSYVFVCGTPLPAFLARFPCWILCENTWQGGEWAEGWGWTRHVHLLTLFVHCLHRYMCSFVAIICINPCKKDFQTIKLHYVTPSILCACNIRWNIVSWWRVHDLYMLIIPFTQLLLKLLFPHEHTQQALRIWKEK